jgi:hypothetical protein
LSFRAIRAPSTGAFQIATVARPQIRKRQCVRRAFVRKIGKQIRVRPKSIACERSVAHFANEIAAGRHDRQRGIVVIYVSPHGTDFFPERANAQPTGLQNPSHRANDAG